jgi:hypothetical protein
MRVSPSPTFPKLVERNRVRGGDRGEEPGERTRLGRKAVRQPSLLSALNKYEDPRLHGCPTSRQSLIREVGGAAAPRQRLAQNVHVLALHSPHRG